MCFTQHVQKDFVARVDRGADGKNANVVREHLLEVGEDPGPTGCLQLDEIVEQDTAVENDLIAGEAHLGVNLRLLSAYNGKLPVDTIENVVRRKAHLHVHGFAHAIVLEERSVPIELFLSTKRIAGQGTDMRAAGIAGKDRRRGTAESSAIKLAPGRFKMTHYAFGTALMNLVLVPTQMLSGPLADWLGYRGFFALVLLASVPSIWAAWRAPFPRSSDPEARSARALS